MINGLCATRDPLRINSFQFEAKYSGPKTRDCSLFMNFVYVGENDVDVTSLFGFHFRSSSEASENYRRQA